MPNRHHRGDMLNSSLRYFTAVARHGSIREAADDLHIAQSALSRQIHKLEQELGVPCCSVMPGESP
jgi:DNA-binding transcriptional LysR family regulator